MSAHMSTNNRVVLVCNTDGCEASFTRSHVSVHATRVAAEKEGWRVARRDQRSDYCLTHSRPAVSGEELARLIAEDWDRTAGR